MVKGIEYFEPQSKRINAPGFRPTEHGCVALRLLERLRQAARTGETPSTADLQEERVYGLRPVNRIGDLVRGKYNRVRYDIERLDCAGGVYRWRLHEPARPGYPKDKRQTVLHLDAPVKPSKPEPEWSERPRVTGLPLWDGVQS